MQPFQDNYGISNPLPACRQHSWEPLLGVQAVWENSMHIESHFCDTTIAVCWSTSELRNLWNINIWFPAWSELALPEAGCDTILLCCVPELRTAELVRSAPSTAISKCLIHTEKHQALAHFPSVIDIRGSRRRKQRIEGFPIPGCTFLLHQVSL